MRDPLRVIAVAAAVLVVAGCGVDSEGAEPTGTSPSAEPRTTTAQPAGPMSQIVDVHMPLGAKRTAGDSSMGLEIWDVPAGRLSINGELRSQLPIYRPLDGLAWCAQLASKDTTTYVWGTPEESIQIAIEDGEVHIARGPDRTFLPGNLRCEEPVR